MSPRPCRDGLVLSAIASQACPMLPEEKVASPSQWTESRRYHSLPELVGDSDRWTKSGLASRTVLVSHSGRSTQKSAVWY